MTTLNRTIVEDALRRVIDPYTGQDLVSLGAVDAVNIDGGSIEVVLILGYPASGIQQSLSQQVWQALHGLPGVDSVAVDIGWLIGTVGASGTDKEAVAGVKNIIAVASGKGGVGKSTTAVNLALALTQEGANVGLLDADIYGPSQPQMLGVADQRPVVEGNRYMLPIQSHGIQSISMGYLVTEDTPMVWRGPMVSGALQQLLTQTRWEDVDYLIIDLPPGTGDIQLTLSQKIPVTGAVIVTTPQDIALLDAKKGIEMFRKVKVPILGIVENMAIHRCSKCGHEEHIFGEGGGQRIAKEYGTPLLGSLPLDLVIRNDADSGRPSVVADPESTVSHIYRDIARRIGAGLWLLNRGPAGPEIVISDD